MGRIGATLLVAAMAGAVAAGCAGAGTDPRVGRPGGTAEVMPSWTSCEQAAPDDPIVGKSDLASVAPPLPRLGDDFRPVAAILCGQQSERRKDGGEDLMAVESRADDVAALVTALRLPDEPMTDGPCTADLIIPPRVVLLDDAGRWVRPGVPHDACGKPRIEVRNAVDRLAWKRVSARRVQQIESAEAAKSGCGQSWADMVWVETNWGVTLGPSIGPLPAASAPMRSCVYRVPASEQRSGKPAGVFVYGGPLAASRWTAIERAIQAAGPAKPCTTPASRFAVLMPVAGGPEMYVELTGCHRIMVTSVSGAPALRQGDAALRKLLAEH